MASFSAPDDLFRRLPKVDLHRHLEGSVRLSTLLELAQAYAVPLPEGTHLEALVTVQDGDPRTPSNFLSKFKAQHPFYTSLAVVERIAAEAVADAAADGVIHLELRFTPTTLARTAGLAVEAVLDGVIASANAAAARCGISLALIASVNRHDPPAMAEQVARLALERRGAIAALDLAGDEANFAAQPFYPALQAAAAGGLAVTVHAGEWGGAQNVREAIEALGARRIGHGVRVLEDPAVVSLALERGTLFEACLTSNLQTGVVAALERHPLRQMLDAGLVVTINSDDPAISRISLSGEYRLAHEGLGLPLRRLYECTLAAARGSFLDGPGRQRLVDALAEGWGGEVDRDS